MLRSAGAIAAVVVLYRSDFPKSYYIPNRGPAHFSKTLSVPLFHFCNRGASLYSTIKSYLFNPIGVACALIIGAIAMIIMDIRYGKAHEIQSIEKITPKHALVIGFAQCMALWPGMSRSASTMIGGLYMGLDYKTSAKFSFMAAVPLMVAAVLYDLIKGFHNLDSHSISLIGIGMGTAFIVSILGIKTSLKILHTYGFKPFAYYRILLGLSILGFYLL